MKKQQKFHKGDLVRIADDLGECMSHFTSGCDAIVIGSYDDQFGTGNTDSYTLYLEGRGSSSWYYENQLTLISSNRLDLLEEWKGEAKKEADLKGSLDWIFENGEDVLKETHGATISALADCLHVTDLWGKMGEGITFGTNARGLLHMAQPFLKTGDKDGWLEMCKSWTEPMTGDEFYDCLHQLYS